MKQGIRAGVPAGPILTLKELSDIIGTSLKGDPNLKVHGLSTLEKAKTGELSFLTHAHYQQHLKTTKASAVILSQEFLSREFEEYAKHSSISILISDNPRLALAKAAQYFETKKTHEAGCHPTVVIGKDCKIPKTVSIGAGVVIGDHVELGDYVTIGAGSVIGDHCQIGESTVLKPRVTVYDTVQIGKDCLIHSGAVLGSDGFGYATEANGQWFKLPHLGSVVIGNSVEIGANTTVDRGFLEDTLISDGVVIDNLVQVGHNVTIGANTAIAACVAIGGSTHIGSQCMIGGGASIAQHVTIPDKVYLTATTSVSNSIKKPGVYSSGMHAKPNPVWRKNIARFQYLDDMAKRLRVLEKAVLQNKALNPDQEQMEVK